MKTCAAVTVKMYDSINWHPSYNMVVRRNTSMLTKNPLLSSDPVKGELKFNTASTATSFFINHFVLE